MKIKIAFVLLALCMIFSGCGFNKPKCTVEIVTSYSQYIEEEGGVASGTFTETFTVKTGDVFYENNYGKWILNPEDSGKYKEAIAEIIKVDDSSITAVIHGEKTIIRYDTGRKVSSGIIIYDGPSYEYIMTVSEFSE